ncbi:DNA-directed RNA polymerase [Astrocystis sublimbata]|nr:DNA-directed RNA polymerase [Astrocystis sublimbata]
MLLRARPASRTLALPRIHINTLRRPHLPSTTPCTTIPNNTSAAGRRPLVTRPKLAPSRPQSKSTPMPTTSGPLAQRPLATAVDGSMRQDDIPFADPLYPQPPESQSGSGSGSAPLWHIQGFDPAATLQCKVYGDTPSRIRRRTTQGLPSGVDEMMSVFLACLDVDKLERAAIVLDRIEAYHDLPHADLIELHNQYLRAGLVRALDRPETQWAQELHSWFEVHIRAKGVPHTPYTIACMLKVSLLSPQGELLAQHVNRYLDLLPEENMWWSVYDSGVLTQQDFGTIATIYQPSSDLAKDDLDLAMADIQAEETPSAETEANPSTNGPVPEVRAVPQKGLGLETLRGVLSFVHSLEGFDLRKLSEEDRREVQARLEQDCVEAAIRRWRTENENLSKMGRSAILGTGALNAQLYNWQTTLEEAFKKEFALFDKAEAVVKKTAEDMERCYYAPFMRQSTPARLAAVTIMSVLNSITQNGADQCTPLTGLLNNLSRVVEEDVRLQARQRRLAERKLHFRKARQDQSEDEPTEASASSSSPTSVEQPATAEPGSGNIIKQPTSDQSSWPPLLQHKVAAVLLAGLLESATIKAVREHPETKDRVSQMQPAFAHTTVYRKGKRIGVVIPNRALVDLMKHEPRGAYLARHLPMLVEPEPWTKFDRGGFLKSPSQLVRIKNNERDQKIYTEAAIQRGDLVQVTKALDVLGRTGWEINKEVFGVMLEAWNTGEAIANIPPLEPDLPLPAEPDASEDPVVRKDWLKRVKAIENERSGLHSERCFMNFQLDIAKAFRDQTFYFPHNMDFRGRAYPLPAYMNHMGADNVRGILRFANGRELGETGLRWLKVQLANVFGYDKASLDEREAFADNHIEKIYDSCTNPLTGERWWLKAEDQWQCLAACFELKAALDSPDPHKFVSRLPVAQDGTCNGLQHYAALGGDRWGAEQVNLTPSDRPADVYSAVAELVKENIQEDVANGSLLAKAMDGKITRKVVKQTVMTNVYGVTFIGAKAQVLKQMESLYPKLESETGFPPAVLSSYVATKIFKALSTMFRGAHDIQYWLGECAGRVCRALTPEQLDRIEGQRANPPKKEKTVKLSTKKPAFARSSEELLNQFRSTIVWTTPLRMPIVQPYRKAEIRVIHTCLQDLNLKIPERSDPVNRRKQLQAFPPNFIHSLDASHMLLSALECDELGLSFAAVHDSFWTHAADVDTMNRVLRDAFIRIHSEDVIGRLASEFEARYSGSLYLAKVDKSSDAAKAISATLGRRPAIEDELLRERERQRLLASADPKEVRKGQEMVTPASIYENFSASEALLPEEDSDVVGLGDIPSSGSEKDENITIKQVRYPDAEDNSDRLEAQLSLTAFEAKLKKPTVAKERVDFINVWLPLTFPSIPKKGDFDVTALKESRYFFS